MTPVTNACFKIFPFLTKLFERSLIKRIEMPIKDTAYEDYMEGYRNLYNEQ